MRAAGEDSVETLSVSVRFPVAGFTVPSEEVARCCLPAMVEFLNRHNPLPILSLSPDILQLVNSEQCCVRI